MLSGKARLEGCHSSNILRAQLRLASTIPTPVLLNALRSQLQTAASSSVTGECYLFDFRPNAARFINRHTPNTAYMSTTPRCSTRSRNRELKFLKPRGKPVFHERTKEQHVELMRVLQEAEKQYEAQLAQEKIRDDDLEQGDQRAELKTVAAAEDSFTSPFFAIPDSALSKFKKEDEHHSQTEHASQLRRGLPRRSRLPRHQASTTALEQELFYLAHNDPHPIAIHQILKILVQDRKIRPTSQYYEALILANTWPEYGSVSKVEKILLELESEGIEIGANIVTAVVKVLAIHPSLQLLHQMLSMSERRWLQLSNQTFHHLILAMIRTGQTELAAWTLDGLRQREKPRRIYDREIIPDYLVVLLIAKMVEIGDWEGVLRYMYKLRDRRAADREIPTRFWSWLLERASKAAREIAELAIQDPDASTKECAIQQESQSKRSASNRKTSNRSAALSKPSLTQYQQTQLALSNPAHHLTTYIWKYYVTSMSIRPSYTTLLNILHLASATGIPWLAHSVIAVMTYMDGIDELGRPVAKVSPEISLLAEKAEAKEKQILRSQGRDPDKENEEKDREEMEKKQVRDEDEAWWTGFLQQLKEEEELKRKGKSSTAESDNGQLVREAGSDGVSDTDGETAPYTPFANVDSDSTDAQSSSQSTTVAAQEDCLEGLNLPFDRTKVPPGNLWPLFPSIGKLGSAHVDPWDALGPRSSVRGKWTEAQEYYKKIEKAGKKR